ncbi:MAG: XRE family transcriptional regulator [Moraxellaceae bacterium]|nr:XRE family transcriptional regulator [Moraxellaceae bacterium]
MARLALLSPADIQQQLADAVRSRRKALKLSRDELAARSTVPAPTIKKFETTGQISLRQFILLWQSVDSLEPLATLATATPPVPASIEDVLKS